MIIYDDLQHYYDHRCSPESWSVCTETIRQKNTINARFKRLETHRMFCGVLSHTDSKTQR